MTPCKMLPVALLALTLGQVTAAHGQDALYGKQPPSGSAFVRIANATSHAITVTADYRQPAALGIDMASRVTPYVVVDPVARSTLAFTVDDAGKQTRLTYKPSADAHVTVVVEQDDTGGLLIVPIADQADFNQARARLAFYNAVPGCTAATLAIEPDHKPVFSGVAPGATAARTVNPVQALVQAECAPGQTGPTMQLDGMQAGSSYSIWLVRSGTAAGTALFLMRDTLAPYKPGL